MNAGLSILDIPLPAHPEGFQLDPASASVFVNVPDARQITVVDRVGGKPLATWRQKDLESNFPLALAPDGETVASVFRSPRRLVLFDAETGAVKGAADTCGDADDVFFDAKRQRIYVSCGEGMVDVLGRDASAGGPCRQARAPEPRSWSPSWTVCLSPRGPAGSAILQSCWPTGRSRDEGPINDH